MSAMDALLRRAPLVVLAASVAVLGAAFAFQYLGGFEPCVLCIYQRYPYGTAIVLAVLALVLERPTAPWLLGLAALAFLVGAGIAAFHVGVEEGWWKGLEACVGAPPSRTLSFEEALKQAQTKPVVPCDVVTWSLLGISMAGYNVPISLGLAAFAGAAARRTRRKAA